MEPGMPLGLIHLPPRLVPGTRPGRRVGVYVFRFRSGKEYTASYETIPGERRKNSRMARAALADLLIHVAKEN